jgi:hypothetical protein
MIWHVAWTLRISGMYVQLYDILTILMTSKVRMTCGFFEIDRLSSLVQCELRIRIHENIIGSI